MRLRRLTSLSAALTVLILALAVPAAHAAPDQGSIIQDDDLLLYRSDTVRARTLVKMKQLGADAVRVTVLWRVAAEGANVTDSELAKLKGDKARKRARAQRERFQGANPRTYPTRNWDRYDNVVKEARALGLRVLFTVTGPGPGFAHMPAPPAQRLNAPTYKPIPERFGEFVQAVGRRYSGQYRDENAGRTVLPRVTSWSLWNEPNQAGWLSPQWERRGNELVPTSPALYRRLFQAGRSALDRSGHGGDIILLGETAPSGSPGRGPRAHIRPVPFLRELACVAPNGTPFTGAAATARDCEAFGGTGGPLRATGYAHHPYTRKGAPTKAPASPDDFTIANINGLGGLLDTISTQSGGKIPGNLGVFLTEFGYESSPPDPRNGIPLQRQAQFNQLAEFLAFNSPRVKATTQFQLRDAAPLKKYTKGSRLYWFTYQAGLLTLTGRPKPAAVAYAMPFVIYPAGAGTVGFWGQLRFRPGGQADTVVVQWQPNAQTPFAQVGPAVKTDFRGFFQSTVPTPGPGGRYRAAYVDAATGKILFASLPTP